MTSSSPLSSFSETKINENLKPQLLILKKKSIESNNYRHLYIVIEQEEGTILPVSFEMLGEGRRLMDDFNNRYKPEEKVVAIILGHNIKHLMSRVNLSWCRCCNMYRSSRTSISQKPSLYKNNTSNCNR